MTEKKKPAEKKPAAKKAPAKKAAPKKAAAPKKPATKKTDSDELQPLTGAVTPPAAEPQREKIEIKPAEPTPIPERAKAPTKKKGFLARLFRR